MMSRLACEEFRHQGSRTLTLMSFDHMRKRVMRNNLIVHCSICLEYNHVFAISPQVDEAIRLAIASHPEFAEGSLRFLEIPRFFRDDAWHRIAASSRSGGTPRNDINVTQIHASEQ